MTRRRDRRRRLPPLNWLRAFEVSARHLSFTLAAEELGLTQAAISQQIRGLETHLGTTLFQRLPRGVALSDAGRAYLPAVRDGIERMAVATEEIFGAARMRSLSLRINLVFMTSWLAPRLSRFRARHPDIALRFSSNIWQEDRERREVDIEVRYGAGHWDGMQALRLTRDSLIPACAPGLTGLTDPASALERHGMLHVIGYGEGWGHWLRAANLPEVDPALGLSFDTLIAALAMAEEGIGFALARSDLNGHLLRTGRLAAPFGPAVPVTEGFFAVRRSPAVSLPQVEAFWDWLRDEIDRPQGFDGPEPALPG